MRLLHADLARLRLARTTLIEVQLIAYEAPFYQILSLAPSDQGHTQTALRALRETLTVKE